MMPQYKYKIYWYTSVYPVINLLYAAHFIMTST